MSTQQQRRDVPRALIDGAGSLADNQNQDAPDVASCNTVSSPVALPVLFDNTESIQSVSPWAKIAELDDGASLPCVQPLNPEQACLLKYFIDHIAKWFDTCDERNHFQVFVPVWARQYPPLLNAICATASRHLHRTATSRTTDGIFYEGYLLTQLTASSSVEHMLACIPALMSFHESHHKVHKHLIVATAIVLRQYEEMDDEKSDDDDPCDLESTPSRVGRHRQTQVNFLDIINAIIRSSHDEGNFNRHELLDVAYWICLRQEVYSAFTQKRVPQMLLAPEQWANAATVNKMVMHGAQVAKWLFEDRSLAEWSRLSEQQAQLEQASSTQTRFVPILRRPPDRTTGEVFPTIWFGSDLVVVGIQHVMIAKMVLVAEAPDLVVAPDRHAHRKAETEVRNIILDLCGTAVHRPSCPPALVNAIMGILLYGDFFTDDWQRQALAGVVERFRAVKAWPLPHALWSYI